MLKEIFAENFTLCVKVFLRSNWKTLHLANFFSTTSCCGGYDKYEVWKRENGQKQAIFNLQGSFYFLFTESSWVAIILLESYIINYD